MDLETFQAPTLAEVVAQVKRKLGTDAVILNTRTFQKKRWLGLRRREIVEITAARARRPKARQNFVQNAYVAPKHVVSPSHAGLPSHGGVMLASGAVVARTMVATSSAAAAPALAALEYARAGATQRSSAANALQRRDADGSKSSLGFQPQDQFATPADRSRALLESPAGASAAMMGFTQEINSLKTMMQQLVKESQSRQAPTVPEELFEFYMQLIENQVATDLASDIIKTLQKSIRPEHIGQKEFVRSKLVEQLEKMLPASGPIVRKKRVGPHVVALIGPTGVGKTTTVAKLAANLRLREKQRVGLITIDTYRIAAVDQLTRYAEIIGAPVKVVSSPESMADAVKSMSNYDYVLIDTAGRSPTDTLKLAELRLFLAAATPDEVHLVLSTTASQACVELAINRFSNVRVDKIIFTKLDEAAHVGVVLNVVKKVNKSLSYITTGQDVPNDIDVGHGRKLAQMILGGSQ